MPPTTRTPAAKTAPTPAPSGASPAPAVPKRTRPATPRMTKPHITPDGRKSDLPPGWETPVELPPGGV
ncbi:MAG TPA: response regulator, partial [bacterium]|nr:response regulator [bacterium]